jgi:hypothetical protein
LRLVFFRVSNTLLTLRMFLWCRFLSPDSVALVTPWEIFQVSASRYALRERVRRGQVSISSPDLPIQIVKVAGVALLALFKGKKDKPRS